METICLHTCIERILMTSLLGASTMTEVEVNELRFEPTPSQFVNENSTTQPN